jgi:hypothetical protein
MEVNVKIIEAARKVVQSQQVTDELIPIEKYDGMYVSRGVVAGMQPICFMTEDNTCYTIGTKAA